MPPTPAARSSRPPLSTLSLDELGRIAVTSVSRREEILAGAAASIFVITAEDIRRSGAHTLPEVLRLAPNLNVARADTSQYAVSARGFNNLLANRMLVLVDGRTVYSPLFSGVLWDEVDVPLHDVERIEVLSGPGATLWGANAVNGVINVITRSSSDTQGSLAGLATGNLATGLVARHGGTAGPNGSYRLYARAYDHDASRRADGSPVQDAARRRQVGFRADWRDRTDTLTVQGDAYGHSIDQPAGPRSLGGGNLLARWSRTLDGGSTFHVQAYYDHRNRRQPEGQAEFRDRQRTYDIEFQHSFAVDRVHQVVWGAGQRTTRDSTQPGSISSFEPADRTLRWSTLFVQDEIALHRDLALTLGAKLETNVYTDSEFLPSARLAWRPSPEHLLWGALSRAVRAPSRLDRDYFTPAETPLLRGGPGFVAEVSRVAELGYRGQLSPLVSLSVTAFRHDHDRLRSLEPGVDGGLQFANAIEGRTTGAEGWVGWQVNRSWRLTAGGTVLDQSLRLRAGAADAGGLRALGNDPGHWWSLRSVLDLTSNVGLDATLRRVGALPDPQVPAYTAVDLRLGWQATRSANLALIVRNLLDPGHPEWGVPANRVDHERGVFLRLLWRP